MYVNVERKQQAPQAPPPRRPSKRQKAMRVLVTSFIILVVALIGCGVVIYLNISKIWSEPEVEYNAAADVSEEPDDVAGLPEVSFEQGDVSTIEKQGSETDILMLGVDNRNRGKFSGRSDVMMYLRVDTEKKTIKMVSFMRDTLVNVEGHGKSKLNAAFSFGGTDLIYNTYEKSFGLTPDYYMVVNFYGMEDIIDSLGGVDVSIDKDELEWLNININEINKEDSSGKVKNINKSGDMHLNGRQAVAYMRIRHPGGDAGRIERQQTVLHALFDEMKDVNVGEIPDILGALVEYVRTDMPLSTMLDLASSVRGMSGSDLETFRYPEKYENGSYNGSSVVQPEDFTTEYSKLIDFLEN
jgi:LCP family protein required for cell wall assembly